MALESSVSWCSQAILPRRISPTTISLFLLYPPASGNSYISFATKSSQILAYSCASLYCFALHSTTKVITWVIR